MSLTLRDFCLRIYAYTRYSSEKLQRLEKENSLLEARLDALSSQGGPGSIFINFCRHNPESGHYIAENGVTVTDPCDVWFVDGEQSEIYLGNNQSPQAKKFHHCADCHLPACAQCAKKFGWDIYAYPGNVFNAQCPECQENE